ncbi:MAG: ABC transporter permease [Candidatus Methanoperedens sp.]|nr:ABC transporter permease [Candidatus Methanoperedens sp.]
MSLRTYIAKRLLHAVLIAWGVMTAAFFLMRLGPNSPADKYIASLGAGHNVTAVVAAIESRYGIDKPLHEQYFNYIASLLQGDWGWSFGTSMPVMELIKTHWIYSFQLVLLSSIFAIVLGISLGMFTAVKKNSRADHIAAFFSFAGISIPHFWLGIMLILIFSVKFGWFKTYYDTSLPMLSLENLHALTLPVFTLGTGMVAGYSRYVRSAMLENMGKDFVRTARAKGLPERTVIGKHVFRNAMLPVITIIMLDMSGIVFGGAYITEVIFGIPGLGWMSLKAVFADDYSVVMAVTLIGAFVTLLFNLLADIAYIYLDPRIRYE